MEVLNVVSIAFAALALAVALLSWRETRRGQALAATIDLFREYRSDQMRNDRRILRETLRRIENGEIKNPERGLNDLPEDAAQAALRLSHYLDHLGVLVKFKLFRAKFATGFLGVTAVQIWEELDSYIAYERQKRHENLYLNYFEHLVVSIEKVDVSKVRANLNRRRPDAGDR